MPPKDPIDIAARPLAIASAPMSQAFLNAVEEQVGTHLRVVTISQLRRVGLMALLRTLLSSRSKTVYVVAESGENLQMLSLLSVLASFTRARRIALIAPDRSVRTLGRFRALLGVFGIVRASIGGFWAVLRCRRELARLQGAPLTQAHFGSGPLLYLQCNLWFGVQAGGSVGHIAGVANALARREGAMELASFERPLMLADTVQSLDVGNLTHFGIPPELNLYRAHEHFVASLGRKLQASPRFIYQRNSTANHTGVVLSRQFQVPLVLEYNGSEVWAAQHWSSGMRFADTALKAEVVSLRHAHLVVTVSDVLRDELIERGVPAERIVSYPNCIDPERFDPERHPPEERARIRADLGIPADARVVTFIGTFGQWHGVDVLAQAIQRLVDTDAAWLDAHKVHFLLIGDGLKRLEVERILQGPRYGSYYTLTGIVPQARAPAYLAASDVLVSPHVPNPDGSRFFGSPTKLFEYMAMGKGIVASALEQIADVLQPSLAVSDLPDGSARPDGPPVAVLGRPGDVDDLISGIRFLVAHPEWAAHLGANARTLALGRYTWEQHVAAILQGLERIMPEGTVQ